MARQRIVAGTVAQLSWQAVDQNGEPADPGTTTVGVTDSAGSVVLAPGTATAASDTARIVTAPAHAVDQLTVTWSGATASQVTYVDVVGGVFFTSAQLRAQEPAVASVADYPLAAILEARQIVETVFEKRTHAAFVPRFSILTTDARCFAARTGIRSVAWYSPLDATIVTDATMVASAVDVGQGGAQCASGVDRLGVVHGFDVCPADVAHVAMLYCRHLMTAAAKTNIDMRTLATSSPDGQVAGQFIAGRPRFITGIEEIDEVLRAYRSPKMPRLARVSPW